MIRSLWVAKTGLDTQQTNVDVISNNLANTSTHGFKRVRPVFEDLLYQTLRQPGAQTSQQTQVSTGLQLGVGARAVATSRIFVQGTLQQTDNPLNLAISGDGFFQIETPEGTRYTRDGNFQRDNQGRVTTVSGFPLIPAITVPSDAKAVTVSNDGQVSITQASGAVSVVGNIQLAAFINPNGLDSLGQNLFAQTPAAGDARVDTPGANGIGSLQQNFLEASNVNVAEELVNLIAAQRAYEINSRSIQTSDQMLQKLTQL
ncbi:MAG: flagellar basal-body rod protein FlgG [Pseudomonadota bacterium]